LVVSLASIGVTESDGSSGGSADFSDGSKTVALLSRVLGTPSMTRDDHYQTTSYDWGAVRLLIPDFTGAGLVQITAAEVKGLTVRTTQGIHVGSTVAEVQAAASPGTENSPAGTPDTYYGLDARPHPGTESLAFPGKVGSDFIEVHLVGGVVVGLRAPFGDWQDV